VPALRVLVLGDANVDLVLHVPPRRPDGRRDVREPIVAAGGTAANTARALAGLGVSAAFAGAVGDDAFGRLAVAELVGAGVDTGAVTVTREAATCQVIAMVEPDGERSLVVWPPDGGALRWLRPLDVPASLLDGAAWLHTTGMCLRDQPVRDTVLAAMGAARVRGVPVSIDLNLRVELWGLDPERRAATERAIELADVVLGSGPEELVPLAAALGRREASAAGRGAPGGRHEAVSADTAADAELATAPDAITSAARRLAANARTVVARLGPEGALACGPDGAIVASPGFGVDVRNVIGAGDAFNAGFVAAMVDGRGLAAALRWGNAAAACHVGREPGAPMPTRTELMALLA
jgi:fructokinase/2-dehydro-3-deoxygluconokinase